MAFGGILKTKVRTKDEGSHKRRRFFKVIGTMCKRQFQMNVKEDWKKMELNLLVGESTLCTLDGTLIPNLFHSHPCPFIYHFQHR
ncbi:hypothetical protein AB3S75_030778 [Citrus x aurantiifolia]